MAIVDRRIVDLQFNNKQFESGISKTVESLENLKDNLKVEGIADGVDTIASRFTTLGVIATTALQNIVDKAVDAGIKLVKSLSLDPIIGGFKEYELKMKSIQTIMVNTAEAGTTMEQVTGVLEELNEYADKTVFSFSDMTTAIGRLTASGVKLEDAAGAIKGISNVAAGMGGDLQNANTAFVQLGQSIAGGRLELQDWKSVVAAGVGGPYLQNALMDAAVAAGEMDQALMDAVKNGEKSFISLIRAAGAAGPEVAISSQSILKALNVLAEDETLLKAATEVKSLTQLMDTLGEAVESSWAITWETIIGNKDEAVEVWTAVNNAIMSIIGPLNDARNEVLKFWKENEGRDLLIKAIGDAFNGIKSVITPIADAFRDVFGAISGTDLINLTKGFAEFTEKLTVSEETASKIRKTFQFLFSSISTGLYVIGFSIGVFKELSKVFIPIISGLLNLISYLKDLKVSFDASNIIGDIFINTFENILSTIEFFADGIKNAVGKIGEYFNQFGGINLGPLKIFTDETKTLFSPFTFILDTLAKTLNKIKDVFGWLIPYFAAFASGASRVFKKIGDIINSALHTMGFENFFDLVNAVLTGGILISLKKFIDGLGGVTGKMDGFLGKISGILDGVTGALEGMQAKLKAEALMKIAIAVGVLAASLLVLSIIPKEDLTTGLMAITVLMTELAIVMRTMTKLSGGFKIGAISVSMIALAGAVLILSAAMKILSTMSWDEILKGLAGIAGILLELVAFQKLLGNGSGLIKLGLALIPLSTGMVIMAAAMKIMGSMEWEELAKGLIGIGGALLSISAVSKIVKPSSLLAMGVSMVGLGAGMVVMAAAMKIIGSMEWEELAKGLTGIGVALLAISVVSKLTSPGTLLAMGVAMVGVGAGLVILASAMKIMSSMDWNGLAIGLVGIGGALLVIAAFSKLVNPGTLLAMGVAMVGVGAGLAIISSVLKSLSSLSWDELAVGLTALGGSLLILAAAMQLMKSGLAGAAAMLVMAAALALLLPTIKILSSMSLSELGLALLALVGIFAVFAGAALLLSPVVPVMIGLAGAIALLGVGVLALGAGLFLLSAAMAAFAISGTAGAGALALIVASLIGLIPLLVEQLGAALIVGLQSLITMIPQVLEILWLLLDGVIKLIIEYIPPLMVVVGILLDEVLKLLLVYVPKIVDVALEMITGVLWAIERNIDDIVVAAVAIVVALVEGISKSIPMIVDAIFVLLEAIVIEIGNFVPRLVDLAFIMMIEFLNGMAETIRTNVPLIVDAFWNLIEAVVDGIVYSLEVGIPNLKKQMKRIADAMWKAFCEFFGITNGESKTMFDVAGDIISGLANGLISGVKGAVDAIVNLGQNMWEGFCDFFGIASPSKLMEEGSGYVVEGHNNGIINGIPSSVAAINKWQGAILNTTMDANSALSATIAKARQVESKKEEDAQKASYDAYVSWINKRVDQGKMAISEEMEHWKILSEIYADNAELYEKAMGNLYTLEKDRLKQIKDLEDEVVDKIEEYEKALDDRTESILDSVKVTREAVVTEEEHAKTVKDSTDKIKNLKKELGDLNEIQNDAASSQERITTAEKKREVKTLELENAEKRLGLITRQNYKGEAAYQRALDEAKDNISSLKKEIDALGKVRQEEADASIEREEKRKQILADIATEEEKLRLAKIQASKTAAQLEIEAQKKELKALKEQYSARKALTMALTEQGMDSKQTSELMGELTTEQISALSKASESELKEFNQIWAQSQKYARAIAKDELSGMKEDTKTEITKLRDEIKSLGIGEELAKTIANGLAAELPKTAGVIKTASKTVGTTAGKTTAESFTSGYSDGIKENTILAETAGEDLGNASVDGSKTSVLGQFMSGVNAGEGFISGLWSKEPEAEKAGIGFADTVTKGISKRLQIQSPSKVTEGQGENTGEGFVNGLISMLSTIANTVSTMGLMVGNGLMSGVNFARDSGKDLGEEAVGGLRSTLIKIGEILDSDFDFEPTIRPVIDMTRVEDGLNTTFGQIKTLNVGEIKGKAQSAMTTTRETTRDTRLSGTASGATDTPIQITQNNYVRNNQDIDRINFGLNNLVTKYNRAKGVPVTQ